ncbi:MAG: hypothetical protein Q8R83_01795 [Legionellaceae bacterium]|nr:hypothetical protein [Legionellaceae bacterium]
MYQENIEPKDSELLSSDTPSAAPVSTPDTALVTLRKRSHAGEGPTTIKRLYSPGLFSSALGLKELLQAILWSNVKVVLNLVQKNPDLLYEKRTTTKQKHLLSDEYTYYFVSPLQLIVFLGDWDLLDQITPFIASEQAGKSLLQLAELENSGSDLIKIDRDPTQLTFDDLTQFVLKTHSGEPLTELSCTGTMQPIVYPLLENKDGIILFQDQWYYVRLDFMRMKVDQVVLISSVSCFNDEKFITFKKSFDQMPMNSGRRSSNAEHALIYQLLGYQLERNGVEYEWKNVRYRAGHAEYLRANAYRTYIDLLPKKLSAFELSKQFQQVIGPALANGPVHELALLCAVDLPLCSHATFEKNFKREFMFNYKEFNYKSSLMPSSETAPVMGNKFKLILGDNLELIKGNSMDRAAHFFTSDNCRYHYPVLDDEAGFRAYDDKKMQFFTDFQKSYLVELQDHDDDTCTVTL